MQRKGLIVGVFFTILSCSLVSILAISAVWLWITPRVQSSPASQQLFPGITYQKEIKQSPRLMVIHIITINLREKGLSFLVTPGDSDRELPIEARTTSQFLTDYDLQLAVNGDGFTPWYSNNLLDYYPHSGDPVDPIGFAASQGAVYSQPTNDEPVLYISRTNRARFNNPIGGIFNAISGNIMLLRNGQPFLGSGDEPQPRTAIALDKKSRQLILVVVDGRQKGYSEGATLEELVDILLSYGAYNAMNLDGGGSSTMVIEGSNGSPTLLNSPINSGIPGQERPVANHLGVSCCSGK
jgi:hypothetical protein